MGPSMEAENGIVFLDFWAKKKERKQSPRLTEKRWPCTDKSL